MITVGWRYYGFLCEQNVPLCTCNCAMENIWANLIVGDNYKLHISLSWKYVQCQHKVSESLLEFYSDAVFDFLSCGTTLHCENEIVNGSLLNVLTFCFSCLIVNNFSYEAFTCCKYRLEFVQNVDLPLLIDIL